MSRTSLASMLDRRSQVEFVQHLDIIMNVTFVEPAARGNELQCCSRADSVVSLLLSNCKEATQTPKMSSRTTCPTMSLTQQNGLSNLHMKLRDHTGDTLNRGMDVKNSSLGDPNTGKISLDSNTHCLSRGHGYPSFKYVNGPSDTDSNKSLDNTRTIHKHHQQSLSQEKDSCISTSDKRVPHTNGLVPYNRSTCSPALRCSTEKTDAPPYAHPRETLRGSPLLTKRQIMALKKHAKLAESESGREEDDVFSPLEEMVTRMHVSCRRPSYILWRERLESNEFVKRLSDKREVEDKQWSERRLDVLPSTIDWLKREIVQMREQDALMREEFLRMRQDLSQIRLRLSCAQHREILDDAMDIEEERDLLGDLSVDFLPEQFDPALKHVGLTKLNIDSRRFSIF